MNSLALDLSKLWLHVREMIRACLEEGYDLPLLVTAITTNARVLMIRVADKYAEPEVILGPADDDESDFNLPVHIVFTDPGGKAAYLLVDAAQAHSPKWLH